jgi:phage tail sheath gpL-like
MTISFNQIPVNLLTPGQYVEFDNTRAIKGLVGMPHRILLIAPKLAAGTATADAPLLISNEAAGVAGFGRGSIGASMVSAMFRVQDWIETWILPVADSGAGVQAAGTITIAGAPTAAGTLQVYIAGRRVQVGVATTDTPTTIATALAAAINADGDMPATASSALGVVTVTSRHKGTLGNDIDMRVNYYPQSETTPTGITVAIVALSGGSGDPSIATALAAIGTTQYTTLIMGFNDAANLPLLETELDNRWGPLLQNDGHAHVGLRGTVGTINSFLSTRNNPHISMWSIETGGTPNPLWDAAALAGATAAYYFAIDPARPLQTLQMTGMLPAPKEKRWTRAERNNVLSYGGATFVTDDNGTVRIERAVTTYTLNAYNLVDPSYRDAETLYTLSYLRYSVRARISQKFPRYKLANDGTRYGAGQAVVTPKIIRAELIALFRDWEDAALVEDFDQFKEDLIVERNTTDVNRVDVLLPPNIVNQFRVFAAQLQFRL